MKRRVLLNGLFILLFITSCSLIAYSQDFPERPVPPRLVNDFAGILSAGEVNSLEHKLVVFNDSTSTQIAIVIVTDLKGYAKADYAQRLAEKWGVGQKGLNNGVLILLRPKTESATGEVQITQGYGLEGAIPDLTCSEIIDNDMLPAFRQGDYFKGLDKATTTLMALARGEYTAEQYGKSIKKGPVRAAPIGIFIIIVIILALINSGKSNHNNISRSGLPFWVLLGMMNSGRGSHNGSWGGFSGGGGGGGGFGGFGGGSFGGGGAGGSW